MEASEERSGVSALSPIAEMAVKGYDAAPSAVMVARGYDAAPSAVMAARGYDTAPSQGAVVPT